MEALIETIKAYLARRGDIVIPTARAAGQERLKIAFRGLYRSLPDHVGYERFEDIIAEIEADARSMERVRRMGLRIIEFEGEKYVEAPLDLLEELLRGVRREGRGPRQRV